MMDNMTDPKDRSGEDDALDPENEQEPTDEPETPSTVAQQMLRAYLAGSQHLFTAGLSTSRILDASWASYRPPMVDYSALISVKIARQQAFNSISSYAKEQTASRMALSNQVTVSALLSSYSALLPNYGRMLGNLSAQLSRPEFLELFRRHQPDNWEGALSPQVRRKHLMDLAREGIPTAWVPGPTILIALVKAEPDQRLQVLLDHSDQILADCGVALDEAADGDHSEQVVLLRQAIAAYGHGLFGAAQALAGSILDTVLREASSPWRGYKALLKKQPTDDVRVVQIRYYTTMVPLHPALEEFWQHKGDPIPPLFNRHATTHAAGAIQFTSANALVGLLLAVSLIREFHQQHLE